MKFSFTLSKNQEKLINSSVAVFLIIGILILLNIAGSQFFTRFDLTRDKTYSLSKGSKDLMLNLDDKVIAKAYFTQDAPEPYNEHKKFVEDKLAEYRTYAKGMFSYEIIDPADADEAQQDATSYGVQPFSVQTIESDELSLKAIYSGLVLLHGDQKEVIPQIHDTAGLEYDISSAVQKLTREDALTIGFLQVTDKTKTLYEDFTSLQKEISKIASITSVTPENIAEDLDVLIIAGVIDTLDDYTLYQIDQAVMRGTKTIFLVDIYDVGFQQPQPVLIQSGLDDLLAYYGVTVDQNMILDAQAARVPLQYNTGYGIMQIQVDYPYIPAVTDFGDSVITQSLNAVTLPFVSSITLDPDLTADMETSSLLLTTKNSWSEQDQYNIDPTQQFAIGPNKGPFTLAVSLTGGFGSFFADQPIPQPATESATDIIATTATDTQRINSIEDNRMIVVGTSQLALTNFASTENMNFIANCVDWLSSNDDLIAIRSKGYATPILKDVTDTNKNIIKWANILGMPLFIVVIAYVRFRARKKRTQMIYSSD